MYISKSTEIDQMGRALKILHIGSLFPPEKVGGAEQVSALIARSQAALGHEVHAAALAPEERDPHGDAGVLVHSVRSQNPFWITEVAQKAAPLRVGHKIVAVTNLVNLSRFKEIIAAVQPDIVHTHSMVELPPQLWATAKQAGCAVVHTFHDFDLVCIRAALFRRGEVCLKQHAFCRGMFKYKKLYSRSVDLFVGVSEEMIRTHRALGAFVRRDTEDLEPSAVVLNPIELPSIQKGRRQRMPDEPYVFGFMGRLVQEKGAKSLLEAARKLPPTGWKLLIAGTGQQEEELRALAQGLPVTFLGHTTPSAFYDQVDCLVVPSVWIEPFGLVVTEALAARRPVVGFATGGIADLINRVEPAWLAPRGDETALAGILNRFLISPPDISAYEHSIDALLDDLSPEKVAQRYLRLYARVLNTQKGERHESPAFEHALPANDFGRG